MAIAFDAFFAGSCEPGTAITYSHNCTGANGLLIVGISSTGGAGGDIIGTVNYNGVPMTRGTTIVVSSTRSYLYFLANPTSGANNVVISASASETIRAASVSYNGAAQIGQLDGTNTASQHPGTSVTTTITTTADNSWNVSFIAGQGQAFTPSTGVATVRGSVESVIYLGDSNAPKTPPGAYPMTWTGANFDMLAIQVSASPFLTSGGNMTTNSKYWGA